MMLAGPRRLKPKGLVLIVQLVLSLFVANFAWADIFSEIRIIDGQGLTRAIDKSHRSASVEIKFSSSDSISPVVLANVDGLSRDIKGVISPNGVLRFSPITPGTWEIRGVPKSIVVKEVRIVP